jgi:hypothetical protein
MYVQNLNVKGIPPKVESTRQLDLCVGCQFRLSGARVEPHSKNAVIKCVAAITAAEKVDDGERWQPDVVHDVCRVELLHDMVTSAHAVYDGFVGCCPAAGGHCQSKNTNTFTCMIILLSLYMYFILYYTMYYTKLYCVTLPAVHPPARN